MKQEAMQCIPRSVNLCRQVIRFNETRVQETKLCIQTKSHAMCTSFLNVFRRVILFMRYTRVNKSNAKRIQRKACADKIDF